MCLPISFCMYFYLILEPTIDVPRINPCEPSPCGLNSQCRVVGEHPACSCLPNFNGRPPNCRPECTINAECPGNLACINEKCRYPCPGSCGSRATCFVLKHSPVCQCDPGYTGDPFAGCSIIPSNIVCLNDFCLYFTYQFLVGPIPDNKINPCNPSPCGANAVCKERNNAGSCICLPEYFGDPYTGCRPECILNTDCPRDKSCVNNKCKDPCPGMCGLYSECRVNNHAPACFCMEGYIGNPIVACHIPVIDHCMYFI